jgi:hypothetical protein
MTDEYFLQAVIMPFVGIRRVVERALVHEIPVNVQFQRDYLRDVPFELSDNLEYADAKAFVVEVVVRLKSIFHFFIAFPSIRQAW